MSNDKQGAVRGVGITLDETFEVNQGEQGVAAYVDVLLRTHEEAHGEPTLEETLAERLGAAGIQLPEFSYTRLAEQLSMTPPGQLTIRNSHGEVIAGPERDVADKEPDVNGAEDPASDERPFYT